MLDLSPSTAAAELLNKGVTSSSLLPALRKSLAGLVRPFYVPGSQLLLKPDIYVTVSFSVRDLLRDNPKNNHLQGAVSLKN